MSTVTFTGTSGSLSHSASLALTVVAATTTNAPECRLSLLQRCAGTVNPVKHYDYKWSMRPSRKVGFHTVDRQWDAEPLYLSNVIIGRAVPQCPVCARRWQRLRLRRRYWRTDLENFRNRNNETTSDNHGCSQISPEIGISATPVIDRKQGANGTIFVVG